jgi:hypothetical protein
MAAGCPPPFLGLIAYLSGGGTFLKPMIDSTRLTNRAILPPKNQTHYQRFLSSLVQLATVREDDMESPPKETYLDDSGKVDCKEEE